MPVQRLLDETEYAHGTYEEVSERMVSTVSDVESVWPAGAAALDYIIKALGEGRITESNPVLALTLGRVTLMHLQGVLR